MSPELIRFFALVAIFASVFLLVQVLTRYSISKSSHISAINKRMTMIARGMDRDLVAAKLRKNDPELEPQVSGVFGAFIRKLRGDLLMAGIPYGPYEVGVAMFSAFLLLSLIISGLIWTSSFTLSTGVFQVVLAFSAAVGVFLPLLAIKFLAQRKRKRMQDQFPVALDIFVRALRSGHPVASAIDLLTQEMEDPIGSEFGRVSDEVAYGVELTDALDALAERWDLDDIRMFVVSLSIQNETGGNLAEILENLSHVIRERAALYLKVRALSSEGRMTGILLTVLPVITFVMIFTGNPSFYLDVAQDPIFYIGFPVLILWYFVGMFWIRKLVDLKV